MLEPTKRRNTWQKYNASLGMNKEIDFLQKKKVFFMYNKFDTYSKSEMRFPFNPHVSPVS